MGAGRVVPGGACVDSDDDGEPSEDGVYIIYNHLPANQQVAWRQGRAGAQDTIVRVLEKGQELGCRRWCKGTM